jgi:hypothetical protein
MSPKPRPYRKEHSLITPQSTHKDNLGRTPQLTKHKTRRTPKQQQPQIAHYGIADSAESLDEDGPYRDLWLSQAKGRAQPAASRGGP